MNPPDQDAAPVVTVIRRPTGSRTNPPEICSEAVRFPPADATISRRPSASRTNPPDIISPAPSAPPAEVTVTSRPYGSRTNPPDMFSFAASATGHLLFRLGVRRQSFGDERTEHRVLPAQLIALVD